MKKNHFLLPLLVVVLGLTGCTTFKAEGLSYFKDYSDYTVIGRFEKSVTVNEFLGESGGANLFDISADAMSEELFEILSMEVEKRNAAGIINLDIEYSVTFLQMLVNSITGYVYAPATLTVKGDVVRSKSGKSLAPVTRSEVEESVQRFYDQYN